MNNDQFRSVEYLHGQRCRHYLCCFLNLHGRLRRWIRKNQPTQRRAELGDLFLLSHSLKGILSSFGEESAVTALSNIEEHTRDNIAPDSGDLAIVNKELVTINQQITDYLSNMDQ